MEARTENPPAYIVSNDAADDEVIARALQILDRRVKRGPTMDSPRAVKEFLTVLLGTETREVFHVLYLDSQYRVIESVQEFVGTLNQTSVYPREIIKRALMLNAGAVILAHNHPSGVVEPSRADEALTKTIKAGLAVIDVTVVDHIIVGGGRTMSFAERGLI